MSLKEDLPIDKDDLDNECLDQAIRYERYNRMWAGYLKKEQIAEARLKQIKSVVAIEVRENPEDFNIRGKPNNDQVTEMVNTDPRVEKAQSEYFDAVEAANAAEGVKWAFAQRKEMLQELVRLQNSGYWAEPYVSNTEPMKSDRMEQRKQRRESDAQE